MKVPRKIIEDVYNGQIFKLTDRTLERLVFAKDTNESVKILEEFKDLHERIDAARDLLDDPGWKKDDG